MSIKMEKEELELIRIKKTQTVEMYYSPIEKSVRVVMKKPDGFLDVMTIPINKIFQVKRGLESATQRFYRKGVKSK